MRRAAGRSCEERGGRSRAGSGGTARISSACTASLTLLREKGGSESGDEVRSWPVEDPRPCELQGDWGPEWQTDEVRGQPQGTPPLAFGQFGEMGPGLEALLASVAKRGGADEMADLYLRRAAGSTGQGLG
jgi:hypothetical protein